MQYQSFFHTSENKRSPESSNEEDLRKTCLDNNATTPVRDEVIDAMLPFFREDFAILRPPTHQSGLRIPPLIHGGPQERNRRARTEKVPGIVGLGMACELAQKDLEYEAVRIRTLRDTFEKGMLEKIPPGRGGVPGELLPPSEPENAS